MAITHRVGNLHQVFDWSEQVDNIDNQYGFITQMNMFETRNIATTSFVYDFIENTINTLSETDRRANNHTVGKDRARTPLAFRLPFYNHHDYITPQDIQDQRAAGEPDREETLATVRAEKLVDLRYAMDQTHEMLMFNALVGNLPTGAAGTSTDMYALLNLTKSNFTVDLESDNASTDLDQKISEVKRMVATGVKAGTAIQGVDFILDEALFDEIKNHPKFREVYLHYQNSGVQRLRDDISQYYSWGIVDFFEWQGVRFMAYNPEFLDSTGSTNQVLSAGTGIAIPRGARGLFRAYFGPANKFSTVNRAGRKMFTFEYTDMTDTAHTIETQSSPLYFCTKPEAIIQLT